MRQNSATLDPEKMGEMGEETTNKSKYINSNQSLSRSFRDDRYSCIWRCKFAWNMCSSICSAFIQQPSETKLGLICKHIKIVKEAVNNTKTGINSSTDGSNFST